MPTQPHTYSAQTLPFSSDDSSSESDAASTKTQVLSEKHLDVHDNERFIVSWDENDMHHNPRQWSKPYRMFLVVVVSLYTLLSPISSTMNAPALDTLKAQFHVASDTLVNMMMSISMLAFVVAPMLYGPLSESFGRKDLLQVTNIMHVPLL